MSLSVASMGLAELAQFLVANGSFATVAQAMSALNIVITEGVGATGTAIAVLGGPGQAIVGAAGETALEVAAHAQLAATGTNVTTAGIGLLQGETAVSSAALLGMDLGVVAAGAAPILGVALGAGLYASNPQLWTKISQKLLPFCYPGTTKIPTWAEIAETYWNTSVPKEVIDALRKLFEEEGIPVVTPGVEYAASELATSISQPIPFRATAIYDIPVPRLSHLPKATVDIIPDEGAKYVIFRITSLGNRMCLLILSGGVTCITHIAGGSDYTLRYTSGASYTNDGQTVHYHSDIPNTNISNFGEPEIEPDLTVESAPSDRDKISWVIEYGNTSILPPGEYPSGVSKWDGTTPTEIPLSKPAIIGTEPGTGNPVTKPLVPISPPTTAPEIKPQPEPEVPPQTIPFPWPEPTTPGHTVPWPTEMPWPLPEKQPEWWPVEIPYPYDYPIQYPSPDPIQQPDPREITDPRKQIQPYIQPMPMPYELPAPEPYPLPDPKLDPSQPRKPTIIVTPDPPIGEIIDPVPPSGISPWPASPDTPLPFSQGGGLVTVYHPTDAQLYAFEQWLWVTYADATIDKIFNNPFDGVISLFELYCTPTDVGTQTIKSGFLDSGISSSVISRYTEIDCGTLGIPEFYGNYFDYSPYSKAHVYLPFIGIMELNVDDIVGHAVNITYRIDEYNGSCIAMITVAKVTTVNGEEVEYSNTMYQFSGNCAVELPLAGGSQASIKAGMMQADAYQMAGLISAGGNLLGGIGSALLGSLGGAISGIAGAASSYAYAQANYLSHMLSGKSTVQKSGTFGSSHGAMGIKTPFITITRPKQIQVPNYNALYGYPAHKMVYVGECTGFLRCREVHVVSATANDEEKARIEQLLKAGVYVTE